MISIVLLALLLVGCGDNADDLPTFSVNTQPSVNVTTPTTPTEEEIHLTSSEFAVTPKTVRFVGRHHVDMQTSAYGFYNVAAGFTFTFTGTSLELEMYASGYQQYNLNYVAVTIDDAPPIAVCVDKDGWYTIAEGLADR